MTSLMVCWVLVLDRAYNRNDATFLGLGIQKNVLPGTDKVNLYMIQRAEKEFQNAFLATVL